ncbi:MULTISPECIES: DUF1033 family protein [Listeria]|uniref:DUF1033 family protein n=1 Tax=Listeria TaxID=1637 RepID=UPI000B58EAB9|nr:MULTISPECIES: DUF1033 family protein [Listeria]
MTEWKVLLTTGDYEPWWFFEEWEENIVSSFTFEKKEEAFSKYREIAQQLILDYPHQALKKDVLFAAWNEDEIAYCEDCEDDIQTFHGLILMENNAVYTPTEGEKAKWFSEISPFEVKFSNEESGEEIG